jgi:hypothetical protein
MMHKGNITRASGATFDRYRLVKLTTGKLVPCGAGEAPLGVSESASLAVDDFVAVGLLNGPGTVEIMVSGNAAAGDKLIPAADGMVAKDSGVGTRIIIGEALEAVTGGGVIEVLPYGYGHTLTA